MSNQNNSRGNNAVQSAAQNVAWEIRPNSRATIATAGDSRCPHQRVSIQGPIPWAGKIQGGVSARIRQFSRPRRQDLETCKRTDQEPELFANYSSAGIYPQIHAALCCVQYDSVGQPVGQGNGFSKYFDISLAMCSRGSFSNEQMPNFQSCLTARFTINWSISSDLPHDGCPVTTVSCPSPTL